MKFLIHVIAVVSLLFSCENGPRGKELSKSELNLLSDQFISKIATLKFVHSKEIQLEKTDSTFKHLDFRIKDFSTENEYMIIQVGRLTAFRFEVFYNFHCGIRDKKIYLYNPYLDKLAYLEKI